MSSLALRITGLGLGEVTQVTFPLLRVVSLEFYSQRGELLALRLHTLIDGKYVYLMKFWDKN